MNRTGNGAALCEDPHDFLVMQNLYDAAVRQLTLKFNILNSEFNVLYARNPIHHIDGRVKSQSSIVAKLIKRGLPLSIESARKNINDIAGVRVVCSYIDDVYRVGEMLTRKVSRGRAKRKLTLCPSIYILRHLKNRQKNFRIFQFFLKKSRPAFLQAC